MQSCVRCFDIIICQLLMVWKSQVWCQIREVRPVVSFGLYMASPVFIPPTWSISWSICQRGFPSADQQAGNKLCSNQTHMQIVFHNALIWSKWISNKPATSSEVAGLLDSFSWLCPSLDTLFVCFLHQWTSWVLASSAEVTLLLNLENHINTCVLCINCSPKATVNTLEVSVANLPSFKQNLMQACCSFGCNIFWVC